MVRPLLTPTAGHVHGNGRRRTAPADPRTLLQRAAAPTRRVRGPFGGACALLRPGGLMRSRRRPRPRRTRPTRLPLARPPLQGSQNPMEYNGGAVLAMTGKNCVAIAWCVRWLPAGGVAGVDRRPRRVAHADGGGSRNACRTPPALPPRVPSPRAATCVWAWAARRWRATLRRRSACTTGCTWACRAWRRTFRPWPPTWRCAWQCTSCARSATSSRPRLGTCCRRCCTRRGARGFIAAAVRGGRDAMRAGAAVVLERVWVWVNFHGPCHVIGAARCPPHLCRRLRAMRSRASPHNSQTCLVRTQPLFTTTVRAGLGRTLRSPSWRGWTRTARRT
jgi:hypothetical protein